MPIETVAEGASDGSAVLSFSFSSPRPGDVTTFTRDLSLLLKAGARLDDALELLATDMDVGRLRPVIRKIRGCDPVGRQSGRGDRTSSGAVSADVRRIGQGR